MGASGDAAAPGSHTPVLYHPVLAALQPRAGGRYIDGTVGAGGHAAGILLASAPDGQLLGIDRDPQALEAAARRLAPYAERLRLRHACFSEMAALAAAEGWRQIDGLLLDLGLSSMQLETPDRGFSFRLDGPLDMRFDPTQELTAEALVNRLGLQELADLLRRYGEVPRAWQVAQAIVEARPLRRTGQLAAVVAAAAGRARSAIHPATQTFQALRIAVNDELSVLEKSLEQAVSLLAPGGRLAVISFHSLEDRLVKEVLRRESRDCICPPATPVCRCGHRASLRRLTRKPIRPEQSEIDQNPRARSARLRVAERLPLA